MNPQVPQQTNCINCKTLLAHPATSQLIQCPKCFTVMNVRDSSAAVNIPQQPQPLLQQQHRHTYIQQQDLQKNKPKKKKDPQAPKAASNAYMIFCKEMRPQLKKENELTFGKIGAKLGEMWRNLSNDEKRPYEDKATEDRERYRKEMIAYQNAGGVVVSFLKAKMNHCFKLFSE
jgi:LSD1 subclass zinc finger protein